LIRLEHLEDRLVPAVIDITPGHTGTFATIQAAVNEAFAGDTILADPGPYAEHVTVNKSLVLEGAQYGVDARTRSGPESIVDGGGYAPFYVTANDVTIDGFTIQGASNGSAFPGGFGIEMAAGISGTHILNNVIQNNIAGIALANLSGSDQAVIQYNLFQNNNLPGSASGTDIYADQYTAGAGGVKNVLIDSNTFTNTSFVEGAWALGISNTGTTPFSGITFSNNNVTNHGRGVYFYSTTQSTVTGNTITGATHYAIGLFGSNGSPANSLFTISNNTLNADGAGVEFVNDTSASAYTSAVANAVGADVSAMEGRAFTGVVATFTDANPGNRTADFSASINWGDGNTSPGTISYNASTGTYTVTGSHTYAEEGDYALNVSITDPSTWSTSVGLALGATSWSPDRYAPAGFTPGQTAAGRDGVLHEFISSADQTSSRPAPYNSGFYDFQGRANSLAAGTNYVAVDLYVPASWSGLTQKDLSGNPANWGSLASFWATGVDASGNILSYPIIGFNNQAGSGTGGFQVFNQTNGWTNVKGFTGGDQWYQLGIGIRAGGIDYFVNGQLVYTDTTAPGTTVLSNVMLQGYNGGNDYHIYWSNPNATVRSTPNDIYVENVYDRLFHRVADPRAQDWVNLLNKGTPPATVVQMIENSPEYQTDLVASLYKKYLNRAVDPRARDWVNMLAAGGTVEQVTAGIVSSQEYFTLHGGTPTGFVQGLYQDILGRTGSTSEVQGWVNFMSGGATSTQVALGFLGSTEYRKDVVDSYYHEFLNRTAEPRGEATWIEALASGMTDQDVLAHIFGSSEGYALWS
jgi:parallel beta-helix repeat protein